MRNKLVCLGLIAFILLGAACSQQPAGSLPITHEEARVSQAPAGTITATVDYSATFLLTVSNSTEEPIELPTPAQEHCYANTFWFYGKTAMGWQPKQPFGSYICGGPLSTGDLVPSGLEKEFDLEFLLASRGIHAIFPEDSSSYILRVKYLDSLGQEFFLFTDEFCIGPAAPADKFYVMVENVASGALGFSITNDSDQSLWLMSLCSAAQLGSGWMDEKHSMLQRLTDEGSWACVRVPMDSCVRTTEPIEITAGETKTIDGTRWLQDAGLSLQPGLYRWDVVFYLGRNPRGVYEGRHLFSDVFEYEN